MMLKQSELAESTPYQKMDRFWVKRDDLFAPEGYRGLCGSKLRQSINLLNHLAVHIRENCDNTILCQSGKGLSTGVMLAAAANPHGIKVILCVGGMKESTWENDPVLSKALEFGAEIRNVCKAGYTSAIKSNIIKLSMNHGWYDASYDERGSGITAFQVDDLPTEIETLVVPVGDGVQLAAILRRLTHNKRNLKRVVGVQISGRDRRKSIDEMCDSPLYSQDNHKYEMVVLNKYPYSKKIKQELPNGDLLDGTYEAKAYEWMLNNIELDHSVCFWVVGKKPDAQVTKLHRLSN